MGSEPIYKKNPMTEPYDVKHEEKCPYGKDKGGYETNEWMTMCDLVDKWCLRQDGSECEVYNDYIKEEE